MEAATTTTIITTTTTAATLTITTAAKTAASEATTTAATTTTAYAQNKIKAKKCIPFDAVVSDWRHFAFSDCDSNRRNIAFLSQKSCQICIFTVHEKAFYF